jgi:GNAT superfamily N-acetyltransferase
MSTYLIREIKENELDDLIPLFEEHAIYEQAEYNRAGKRERLAAELFKADSRLNILVVEIGEKIQGYCSYTFDYSTWSAAKFLYMDCLFIREQFRGLGIGSAIIKKLLITAKDNDCENLQWQTPVFNASAITFYKKNGATAKEKVRFRLNVE